MLDEFNDDRTGWARFSDDKTMRYRLARSIGRPYPITVDGDEAKLDGYENKPFSFDGMVVRVVFLMLNPSTAYAFELDPTVNECRKRAISLGADIMEGVNLFAWRSPYPADLKKRAAGARGDDSINLAQILAACRGARFVIAAWGNDGNLGDRDRIVVPALREAGIKLHHLGLTQFGHPKHPLARGKHRIPADQPLVELL